MSKRENQRIVWLALVQIICTVLIVFSHSIVVGIDYPAYLGKVVRSVQIIGLTAFMWCSGYLLVRTNSIAKNGYKTYIKKRFIRLMIPFFVVQFLMLVPKIVIGKLSNANYVYSMSNFIGGFVNPRNGVLPHLWFLPTLMILTLISPLIIKCTKNKISTGILLFVGFLLSVMPQIPNILCVNDVSHYLFWYSLGVVIAQNVAEEKVQNIKSWYYVAVAVVSIPLYLIISRTVAFFSLNEVIKSFFSLAFLVSICVLINKGKSLGKLTFPVYILSLPVQNFAEVILRKIQCGWFFATVIMFFVGILFPILIVAVVSKLEEKIKNKALSRVIGL